MYDGVYTLESNAVRRWDDDVAVTIEDLPLSLQALGKVAPRNTGYDVIAELPEHALFHGLTLLASIVSHDLIRLK